MKTLIIEDEQRAVNQLQSALKKCGFNFQLLDVIDSVEDAIYWLNNNEAPELVFMDIQLADGLSFEIFQKTKLDSPIIFTTAFDQYAIQAFKVNSIDYLLKPIQHENLNRALTKLKKTKSTLSLDPALIELLMQNMLSKESRKGLLVKDGNGYVQISILDFQYFYSSNSLTFGVSQNKRYVIEETIDDLFSSLSEKDFFRINRGQVISKQTIKKIEPYFNHRLKVSVSNPRDQEFIVSRVRTKIFKSWLNS